MSLDPLSWIPDTDRLNSVSKLAEMTAVGLDLPAQFFSDAGKYGQVPLKHHSSPQNSHAQTDLIFLPRQLQTWSSTVRRTPFWLVSTQISTSSPSMDAPAILVFTSGHATPETVLPSRSHQETTFSSKRASRSNTSLVVSSKLASTRLS